MRDPRSQPISIPQSGPGPEALVFDFDGVLADTEPLYWRAWCELLKPCNVSLTWEEYCRIGRGIRDEHMLESLCQLVADPEAMHRLKERFPERKEMVRQWKLEQPPIAEPTVELLKSLAPAKLGLVTSSDRDDIEPLLKRAGVAGCFSACVFGDEITIHKPDPAPYLRVREKLGVSGGVVFEDSDAGMQSAASAGFDVVRVESPGELPGLVWNLFKGSSGRTQNESI